MPEFETDTVEVEAAGFKKVVREGIVLQVQQQAPPSTMYTVRKGDTLWAIAEKHYGKGKGAKYTEIVKANSPPVKDPDLIQPGWMLRLPPLA